MKAMKTILRLIILMQFLMATTCGNDIIHNYNPMEVSITPQANFNTHDTIWLYGKTSSKAYREDLEDSIVKFFPRRNTFNIFKLLTPTEMINCEHSTDDFEIISVIGEVSYSSCDNSYINLNSELSDLGNLYKFKIGLVPQQSGDYLIKFLNEWRNDPIITNENINQYIFESYQFEESNDTIRFETCNHTYRKKLFDASYEYLLTVN